MRFFLFLFLCLFFSNVSLFAQEETIDTPIVSGEIIDKIELPSSTNPITYLIILDKEGKVWCGRVKETKLLQEVQGYKKGEYVEIYGLVINPEARQVEAEKIEKRSLKREE